MDTGRHSRRPVQTWSAAGKAQRALELELMASMDKDLLEHSDMDVKVAVASCVSEITRITAPDAPYDDDLMKVWDFCLYMFLMCITRTLF